MKQIDAMLWVAAHDLVTSYVAQIVPQNLLGEQIDQCLDVHCHLLLVVRFFKGADQDEGEEQTPGDAGPAGL